MKVLVFHPGTQHSRQTALALQQLDRLALLATGIFDHPDSALRRAIKGLPEAMRYRIGRDIGRFAHIGLDPALVRSFPQYELPERITSRLGFGALARRCDTLGNAGFGQRIAALADAGRPLALWGYNGSSFGVFSDRRVRDLPRILDRTVADGRFWNEQRLRIEATHGDWLAGGIPRWGAEAIIRDDSEYCHADRIVCGSPLVAESILRHSPVAGLAEKLEVLPYSYDAALFGNAPEPRPLKLDEPVRLLFAGQVSARKGVQHLLEAIDRIPAQTARLTLVGPVMVPERLLARYRDRVDILGSVPRSEMPAIMQRHHALVFPSHFEGSAVVLIEAMASGLAVIQTRAAGLGASENSGIVLNVADADSVEQAILTLAADREKLHAMRLAAQEESRTRDFASYRAGIASLLDRMGL